VAIVTRSHYRDIAFGLVAGNTARVIPSAPITLVEPGTSTPIADTIYDSRAGVGTLPNPFTADATGTYEFWLAASRRRFDILIDGGVDFNDLRVSDAIALSTDNLVDDSSVQTLAGPKTFSSPIINNPTVTNGTFAAPTITNPILSGITSIQVAAGSIAAPTIRGPDPGTGWSFPTTNEAVFSVNSVQKIRINQYGIVFGPIDKFASMSGNDIGGYGAIEFLHPNIHGNAPKWHIPSAVLLEVVNDTSEMDFLRGTNTTTPGGAFEPVGASTGIGFMKWFGWASGGDWREAAQIIGGTAEDFTLTNHGGALGFAVVPLATDVPSVPAVTIGPNGRTAFDNGLASFSTSVWNAAYYASIPDVITLRGTNNPGITIINRDTVASGNKTHLDFLFTTAMAGYASTTVGLRIEPNVTQVSPLKTDVRFYNNAGNSSVVSLWLTDANLVHIPVGLTGPASKVPVVGANVGVENGRGVSGKDTGGTYRDLITINGSNRVVIGEGAGVEIQFADAKVAWFGQTPASRPAAYTQTYNTATRTHANPTATALTAASGTADGTVADVGASFNQTTLNNNFQDVATRINQIITDLANLKQFTNQIVDDFQTYALFQ
jgi:hypothetical protein